MNNWKRIRIGSESDSSNSDEEIQEVRYKCRICKTTFTADKMEEHRQWHKNESRRESEAELATTTKEAMGRDISRRKRRSFKKFDTAVIRLDLMCIPIALNKQQRRMIILTGLGFGLLDI
ncbi:unnamed protein product [Orchesella dallaii]|uniref:C2H2-type domain-containing protein n=1 Tax=Orchesella dallaii TaxID=48710 RepID=A0ABP1PTK3_9HEXA